MAQRRAREDLERLISDRNRFKRRMLEDQEALRRIRARLDELTAKPGKPAAPAAEDLPPGIHPAGRGCVKPPPQPAVDPKLEYRPDEYWDAAEHRWRRLDESSDDGGAAPAENLVEQLGGARISAGPPHLIDLTAPDESEGRCRICGSPNKSEYPNQDAPCVVCFFLNTS